MLHGQEFWNIVIDEADDQPGYAEAIAAHLAAEREAAEAKDEERLQAARIVAAPCRRLRFEAAAVTVAVPAGVV